MVFDSAGRIGASWTVGCQEPSRLTAQNPSCRVEEVVETSENLWSPTSLCIRAAPFHTPPPTLVLQRTAGDDGGDHSLTGRTSLIACSERSDRLARGNEELRSVASDLKLNLDFKSPSSRPVYLIDNLASSIGSSQGSRL